MVHLLAHAVKRIYPNAKFCRTCNRRRFYYDIDLGDDNKGRDLPKIEKEMKNIKE